jgi:hypothetical protein
MLYVVYNTVDDIYQPKRPIPYTSYFVGPMSSALPPCGLFARNKEEILG